MVLDDVTTPQAPAGNDTASDGSSEIQPIDITTSEPSSRITCACKIFPNHYHQFLRKLRNIIQNTKIFLDSVTTPQAPAGNGTDIDDSSETPPISLTTSLPDEPKGTGRIGYVQCKQASRKTLITQRTMRIMGK